MKKTSVLQIVLISAILAIALKLPKNMGLKLQGPGPVLLRVLQHTHAFYEQKSF